jgi:hypothetical protein
VPLFPVIGMAEFDERASRRADSRGVDLARRHQKLLSRLAFGLLALVAELTGRSLAYRLDVGRHVGAAGSPSADYYPALLICVKVAVALMLARVAWRFVRAHAVARAARRLLAVQGSSGPRAPRFRLALSPRLWFVSFLATSLIYLVQMDAEGISAGRWPLLAPWLHTSALPVFAVLAVAVALVYNAASCWLADWESYARETEAYASRLVHGTLLLPRPSTRVAIPPRRLFGLAFESRPPPLTA